MIGGRRAGAVLASAVLAVVVQGPAVAAPKRVKVARAVAKPAAPLPFIAAPAVAVAIPPPPSLAVAAVRDWAVASADHQALPFAIIDKTAATLWLFDGRRRLLARSPVLIGIAPGDEATPGVGSKRLAELGPAEKTTPAGRFLARYGRAAGRQRVLWVDYANAVALHPIPTDAAPGERRRQRMASPNPADHRITFGCINLPPAFYTRRVAPLFGKRGGYVYVLPESRPLPQVFPGVLTLAWFRAVTPAPESLPSGR